jgi:SWI/SNF-related matrix-associated actin-dependent regulator 1 of chromatin subfamily A
MRVAQVGKRFKAFTQYEERHIPKSVGAKWDPDERCWLMARRQVLELLQQDSLQSLGIQWDGELNAMREELTSLPARMKCSLLLANAEDSEYPVKVAPGQIIRPYQRVAVAFLDLHNGRVLMADEMGTGKTVQILAWLNGRPELNRIVVVCKAIGKPHWQRMINRWVEDSPITKIVQGSDSQEWIKLSKGQAGRAFLIINYDVLSRYAKLIHEKYEPDCVILDEAHFIKNHAALRTKAALKISCGVDSIICATGTPIYNRPLDIWKIIHLLDPVTFPDKMGFLEKYFNYDVNGFGIDFRHATLKEECALDLNNLLKSTCMIRRLKKDIMKDLPPKVRTLMEVDADSGTGAVRKAEEKLAEAVRKKYGQRKVTPKMLLAAMRSPGQAGNMFEWMHLVGQAKKVAAGDFIEELLEEMEDGKIVAFVKHHDVTDYLMARFAGKVTGIDGRTPQDKRDGILQEFDTDPTTRLFVGSIDACGDTISLTAASTVVFVEQHYTPMIMTQAEDRCHRDGQKDSVNVYTLVLNNSLDVVVGKELIRKQEQADSMLDGQPVPDDDVDIDVFEKEN